MLYVPHKGILVNYDGLIIKSEYLFFMGATRHKRHVIAYLITGDTAFLAFGNNYRRAGINDRSQDNLYLIENIRVGGKFTHDPNLDIRVNADRTSVELYDIRNPAPPPARTFPAIVLALIHQYQYNPDTGELIGAKGTRLGSTVINIKGIRFIRQNFTAYLLTRDISFLDRCQGVSLIDPTLPSPARYAKSNLEFHTIPDHLQARFTDGKTRIELYSTKDEHHEFL